MLSVFVSRNASGAGSKSEIRIGSCMNGRSTIAGHLIYVAFEILNHIKSLTDFEISSIENQKANARRMLLYISTRAGTMECVRAASWIRGQRLPCMRGGLPQFSPYATKV